MKTANRRHYRRAPDVWRRPPKWHSIQSTEKAQTRNLSAGGTNITIRRSHEHQEQTIDGSGSQADRWEPTNLPTSGSKYHAQAW